MNQIILRAEDLSDYFQAPFNFGSVTPYSCQNKKIHIRLAEKPVELDATNIEQKWAIVVNVECMGAAYLLLPVKALHLP